MTSKLESRAEPSGVDAEFDPSGWVERYGDYLYGYAMSRVRNEWLAEDLVQDALMAGIKGYASFSGSSSEKTWLCGILKNKIIDHFRKNFRETVFSNLDNDHDIDTMFRTAGDYAGHWTAGSRPSGWLPNPEDSFDVGEFRTSLEHCITELPEPAANVFILREMDGMNCGEICEALQISANNCWVLLHRARMRLRKCLEINWFRKGN